MKKKLTDKDEEFAQLVVATGDQSEAYRKSRNVSPDTKKTSINTEASKLANDPLIRQRIEEIRQEAKKAHKIDRDKIIKYHMNMIEAWEELWELGKKKDKDKEEVQRFYLLKEMVKGSDYRGSLAEISKLTGLYAPEKHEHLIKDHKTNWG